jgi:AGCS family alanine or glycine:cation symporter
MIAVSSGGLKRISSATGKIVPFMSVLFCLMSIAALVLRAERIPHAICDIFRSAFDFDTNGILAGVGGFFLSKAVSTGIMRGLISNKAGAGTSPMAHSTSTCDCPAEQGFLGIIEVFIDTVFLCTLTALVILVSYPEVANFAENSVMMTVGAYSAALGGAADAVMCFLVVLFGLATVFCQCFYGKACLSYLTESKRAQRLLTVIYGAAALAASQTPPGNVWGIADLSIGTMTVINISILILERKRIRNETFAYFSKER